MPESRLGATSSLIGISTYLDTVLQTVQLENRCCQFTEDLSLNGCGDSYLPAGVGDLATGLADCSERSCQHVH